METNTNYLKLANRYNQQRNYDLAIENYIKVDELDPDNPTILMGKIDLSTENYKKALELNPNHKTAHNNMGMNYNYSQNTMKL